MDARLKKTISTAGKLVVTAAAIGWVVAGTHWHDYVITPEGQALTVVEARGQRVRVEGDPPGHWRPVQEFRQIEGQAVRPGLATAVRPGLHPPMLLPAAALFAANLLLLGVRWWRLLRFHGLERSLAATLRMSFVGHFFNYFLPGTTGGDVLRAYLLVRRTDQRTVAVATIFLDRFIGLAGLAALAAVTALLTWGRPGTGRAARIIGGVSLAIVVACLLLFSRRVGRLLHLDGLIDRLPRRANLQLARQAAYALAGSGAALGPVAALTMLIHLAFLTAVACTGAALGLPVPLHLYLLYGPMIGILSAMPVSLGGLGVMEALYIVFFASVGGADRSALLALSLLARLLPMCLSLPGLAFWLTDRGRHAPAPAE